MSGCCHLWRDDVINSSKQQKMNNHRYTYMNGRPTRANQHHSAERSAFTAHNSHSKPSVSKQAQGEKVNEMATKIIQEVNRLHNSTQLRAITKDMLKEGGSKIFFDVFAILARALDEKIEREQLNLEIILNILKLLNYPGNLMKNMFQPIGAPHTWHHCLAILDFMAEIARYALAFRSHCNEMMTQHMQQLQKDDNFLTFKAVFQANPSILGSKYQKEHQQLSRKVDTLRKETQESQNLIKNLHLHQRPLEEVTQEIEAEQKRLAVYENDLVSKKMQKDYYVTQTEKSRRQLDKYEAVLIDLNNQMTSLEYRLTHKELTAEELAKLHEEVKEKKNQERLLEQSLVDCTSSIRRAYEMAITELKLDYAKVNFAVNQVCKHPMNSNCTEIPFSDNFQQLHALCDSLLNPEQPQECNVSQQINTIASAWDLAGNISKANNILNESKRRLSEKQREVYELNMKCQEMKSQEYRMVMFADDLKRRKENQMKMVAFQESQLESLRRKVEKLREANEQVSKDVIQLKSKRLKTEDEVIVLMKEIEEIRRSSAQFQQAMQKKLKVADQSIDTAKMTMLTLLERHRNQLRQIIAKSKASEFISEVLSKFKAKSPHISD